MRTTITRLSLSLLLVSASISGFVASAAAQENPDATPLRVGLSTRYPPVAFGEEGNLQGLEVDLAKAVGQEIRKPVEFKVLEFDALIPALQKNEIDVIMSGMSITDARKQKIAFAEPYMRVGQMALVRSDDFSKFVDPGALNSSGTKVGFVEGTTGGRYVAANLTKPTKVAVEGADQGIAALRDGSIDVFIHDAPTVWRVSLDPKERELLALYEPLTEEYLAWGVRKNDTDLKAVLDAFVQRWKDDGRMTALTNRWIPIRVELKPK